MPSQLAKAPKTQVGRLSHSTIPPDDNLAPHPRGNLLPAAPQQSTELAWQPVRDLLPASVARVCAIGLLYHVLLAGRVCVPPAAVRTGAVLSVDARSASYPGEDRAGGCEVVGGAGGCYEV